MSKYQPKKNHDPIDPEVVLPAAIRAASARSDNLHRAAYEHAQAGDGQGVEPPTPPQGEQKPASPAPQPTSEDRNGTEGKPTQANPETPPSPQSGQDNAQPGNGPVDWEHKYNSLKGRYDQNTVIMNNLHNRLADMESLVARMQESPKAPAAAAPTPSELTFKPIGQEERETFGEDFIDVAQRAALERVSPEIARLNKVVEQLQSQIGSVASTTAETRTKGLYQHLDSEMPNWRVINRDPQFIAWVSLPDPFSGVKRHDMLKDAFNKGDGSRVLRFFQGFLNDEAATDPANRVKPETPPANAQGKIPLETFAAPGRAKAPAASEVSTPGEKETISRAQIANFYRLKAQGHWRGNPEEEAALEQRIFDAERDGRIV